MRRALISFSRPFLFLSLFLFTFLPGTYTSALLGSTPPQQPDPVLRVFEERCFDCHDADTKKGDLDLTALPFDLTNRQTFAAWVKIHDRVRDGEMPPRNKEQPTPEEKGRFLHSLAAPMIAADQIRAATEGRSTLRRMNRYEYENTLRDLLEAPWLQIKDKLPEDGEANRFNKIGDALDISHVQMARYLEAADYALREVMAKQKTPVTSRIVRYYAREEGSLIKRMQFSEFNRSPERATFPVLGTSGQPEVRAGTAPPTVGESNPELREQEGIGVVASSYEPIELHFRRFVAPHAGRYKLRFNGLSVWVGPGPEKTWWRPNLDEVSKGRRPEPVTIYASSPPRQLRLLGSFDLGVEPTLNELDVYLLKGETIRWDASRLFRSRPPNFRNPLATPEGQPGIAFRWMEAEGPLVDRWPGNGHRLLFADLPLSRKDEKSPLRIVSKDPSDAERLLRQFMQRAYRHPIKNEDVAPFLAVIQAAKNSGSDFADAMIAGYTAVLCSPKFVCLEETPGKLDSSALASRLSYFLWNSAPDEELRRADLHQPEILRQQTDRLLADAKSQRFVDAFLDYWLDLRKANATSPDADLYPDYYLDDLLVESSLLETQRFFAELIQRNLPARNVVASDFAMLNERLAQHYALPPVSGVKIRKVTLPEDSVRGGLLTQASVLKVTANGTTTSPVVRGVWVVERILGKQPPPPPKSVPAIEPDTRGAHTIREQLEKHRAAESCSGCHASFDPAGFALENFDVMGGWREQYRALADREEPAPKTKTKGNANAQQAHTQDQAVKVALVPGIGKNGQPFAFHLAQEIDASGNLPDGRTFKDIRGFKQQLLQNEPQIARNLISQLITYATGAPVRFGDRPAVERILKETESTKHGVQSIIHAIVQSELFQTK
jgi:hypothetical protein